MSSYHRPNPPSLLACPSPLGIGTLRIAALRGRPKVERGRTRANCPSSHPLLGEREKEIPAGRPHTAAAGPASRAASCRQCLFFVSRLVVPCCVVGVVPRVARLAPPIAFAARRKQEPAGAEKQPTSQKTAGVSRDCNYLTGIGVGTHAFWHSTVHSTSLSAASPRLIS